MVHKMTIAVAEERVTSAAEELTKELDTLNEKFLSEDPSLREVEFKFDYDACRSTLASSFAQVLARHYVIVPTEQEHESSED